MTDIDHLLDHVSWFRHALELRVRAYRGEPIDDDALVGSITDVQVRIAVRVRDCPTLAARQLGRLGLSASEGQVVWLLTAIAVDHRVRTLLASIGSSGSLDPTIDELRRVVYGDRPSREALAELAPTGALRRLRLIERSDGGGSEVHESRQTWAISRRIVTLLHGDPSVDPVLDSIVRLADDGPALDELALHESAVAMAREAMRSSGALIVASGSPGLGRRTLLVAAAHHAGLAVLEIDAVRLAKDPRHQLAAISRECKLLGRTPLLRNVDALSDDQIAQVGELLDGPILVTCGVPRRPLHWGRPVIAIDVRQPTSAQRASLWQSALAEGTAADADVLATQYPLAPSLIHHAARAAGARAAGRQLTPDDIDAGVRAVLDDRLGRFARRVEVTQTWDDLVIGAEHHDAIVELIARIRRRRVVYEQWGFAAKVGRGLGTCALFSGPPGTGKTMVAALIARELGLELYQVDTAKIMSKWIGETEKQLGELFDAAEAGHAIVLFDEADSLFGKRTDVKSSNDRYANLETNYLLQRLESFTGICVLTSNHESSLDPAFQRRLSLHLRFELPEPDERVQLWRAMLPAAAPVAPDLDLAGLARRFAMTGGYIRNAALRAAFLAADEGSPITTAHLERAARVEYEGMGKLAA